MNTFVGIGLSTKRDPYEAAKEASLQARQYIPQRIPSIIFVFTSIHFCHKRTLVGIRSIFKDETPIVGCTGYGIISPQGTHRYGIVVMAIASETIQFTTATVGDITRDNTREASAKLARTLLKQLSGRNRDSAIILSDGLIERGSDILSGIKEVLGRSFPIVGGSAADNLRFAATGQFFNKEILHNAIVGTILSGEGTLGYGIRHGWQPLGTYHEVTQASGNTIKTIGGKPAVQLYETYFKKNRTEIESLFTQISILYPLGIFLSDEEEYLLRNPVRIERDGSIICQGDVATGNQIRLMMGTKESALQAARQATQEAKHAIADAQPVAAIIFESTARLKLLGYRAKEETQIIRNLIGEDIPLVGVYTFSEQAPLKSLGYRGETHFHNETIAVLIIAQQRSTIRKNT